MSPIGDRPSHRFEILERALNRAQKQAQSSSRRENRFAFARLLLTIFLLAALAALFEKADTGARVQMIAIFIAVLIIAGQLHQRLKKNARHWASIQISYELSQARIKRNFKEIQKHCSPWHKSISEKTQPAHPYASDLDIASNAFTLLNSCSTERGSAKLFDDLLSAGVTPLAAEERKLRHARIKVLTKKTAFLRRHETLRMDAEFVSKADGPFSNSPALSFETLFSGKRILAASLAILLGCVGWALLLIPAILQYMQDGLAEKLYHSVIVYAAIPVFGAIIFKPISDFGESLRQRTLMLELMLKTLQSLKSEPAFQTFSCLKNNALQSFRRLKFGLNLLSVRNNPVLWLALHAFLPYDSIVCAVLLITSRKISKDLPVWEEEITEFDVLCALSRFQWENPHCGLFEASNAPFSATRLGHPLLSPMSMVDNDFAISQENPMVLLTGSNMSGKSTFLRTIGLNLVLFNMGAPVCAKTFSAPVMRILCAIRVDDSLADGMSYFYAEVKRLKTIIDTLNNHKQKSIPSLFLVDEIFRGTNNRERFVGSWSILHTLLDSSAFGLVSTHDLALTKLATHDTRLRNQHFREHVDNAKLVFDYKIKDGPCPTTNALAIMQAEGLPVLEAPLSP
jgi:hypothetical protein